MKYFLVVGRIVGFKGVDLAIEAAKKINFYLKIVGEYAGIYTEQEKIKKISNENIEFLGRVPDGQLKDLYKNADVFLALAKDEDFGMTVVEAMAEGTPVIAYKSGGYLETVIEGKTGVFFEEYTVESLIGAVKKFKSLKFKREDCIKQASKFSKEIFIKKMKEIVYAGVS
jgi:glycosyltransferase involved in cell wall biosynthesis